MSRRFRKIRDLRPVVSIESLSREGLAVAHANEKRVNIHGALPGEQVEIRYIGTRRGADDAVTESVLTPSPDRVQPACDYAAVCSGCGLQHASMDAQIGFKTQRLADEFQAVSCQPEDWLSPVTGPALGYRRRGRLSVRYVRKKDRMLVGFREKNGRYVADVDRCPVMVSSVGEKLGELARVLDSLEGRERIPQIEFACGDNASALVVRHLDPLGMSDRRQLIDFARGSGLQVFLQAGGPESVAALHPDDPEPLWYGLPDHDVKLRFHPLDFIQVNGAVNRRLVDTALGLLAPAKSERVLDLFCGLGNFSLPLARRAREVVGVEGNAVLVGRARENARLNGVDNVEFVAADLIASGEESSWSEGAFECVLMDPPRAGLGAAVSTVVQLAATRLVYVSCNGETLARDAQAIVGSGKYRFARAGIVDMFPHTSHAEAIALFEVC